MLVYLSGCALFCFLFVFLCLRAFVSSFMSSFLFVLLIITNLSFSLCSRPMPMSLRVFTLHIFNLAIHTCISLLFYARSLVHPCALLSVSIFIWCAHKQDDYRAGIHTSRGNTLFSNSTCHVRKSIKQRLCIYISAYKNRCKWSEMCWCHCWCRVICWVDGDVPVNGLDGTISH